MTVGVTPAGFVRPTLDEALVAFGVRLAELLGIAVDTSVQSKIGQLAALVVSEQTGDGSVWELAEQVYDSFDPDKAEGEALDVIASYTGCVRKPATTSLVSVLAVGVTTTALGSGQLVTNLGADIVFQTTAPAVLAAVTAWGTSQTIALLDVRRNSGHVYVAVAAGITASGGGGPTSTASYPTKIVDGTVNWVYVGDSTGFAYIPAQATASGPISAPAFALNQIGTPVSGWVAVANPQDAITGRDIESDDELRLRRLLEIHHSGSSARDVASNVSALPLVTSVTVFENSTDSVNADGMVPHSLELLVSGSAADVDIASAIFARIAGGIATNGAEFYDITDEQGVVWNVRWSTPTLTNIYVELTAYVDTSEFPTDGDVTLGDLILAYGDSLKVGRDVDPTALLFALGAFESRLPGFLAASVKVSTSAITGFTPAMVPVVIGGRARADFDSTRISVVLIARAP